MQRALNLILVILAILACDAATSRARANTLSVTLNLAGLPASITVCRDPTAIQAFGFDEAWQIAIDVDNNANTGYYGFDVLLQVQTPQQTYPCSPTSVSTSSALSAVMATWNSAQNQFVPSNLPATVVANVASNSMTVSADLSGPLANLTAQSRISIGTFGAYTPSGQSPTDASDSTSSPITIGTSATDPANDVQNCGAPCGTSASWYPLIDLVGASATTSLPLPAFGANTVYLEFDLAGLPATMALCRYPAYFATYSNSYDSAWLAALDLDGNSSTPAGSPGGFESAITVYTTLQPSGCTPNSAALNSALTAELDKFDTASNAMVFVSSLPVTADAATGKIIVQADKSVAALSGLSTTSLYIEQAAANYSSPPQTAYDQGGAHVGSAYTAANTTGVQQCSTPCSNTVSWYPQINLTGGSMTLSDEVFRNGFE
ncbi:MAG TPA: hypothetical protein VLS52_07375 [Rudaea sp.]|nr:hypothetical protein [Rudaea sp.]